MNPQDTHTAKARQLTMGYHYPEPRASPPNQPTQPVPYLRLCGRWLKDAGFTIGRRRARARRWRSQHPGCPGLTRTSASER